MMRTGFEGYSWPWAPAAGPSVTAAMKSTTARRAAIMFRSPFCLRRSPHLVRDLERQRELLPLIVHRDPVAMMRAGEAALRRKTQVLQRDVPRRSVDTALEL